MNCHICTKPTSSFVHEKTDIAYYYCKSCEYIFKSSKHHQDLTLQKNRYDLHENKAEDEKYQAYFQRFLDFVLPLVGKPKNALDFGCGKSFLLASLLEKRGIKCDHYDPIYHPNTISDSTKYELIVSTEVFEHLHQPKKVFKRLLRRLKKGGYLAIQTQFHPNDIDTFKKWYYHQDPTHIVFFTPHTFDVLCSMFGCQFIGDNGKNMVVIRKNLERLEVARYNDTVYM